MFYLLKSIGYKIIKKSIYKIMQSIHASLIIRFAIENVAFPLP